MSTPNKNSILNTFIKISDEVGSYFVANKNNGLSISYKNNFFLENEAVTNADKDIENICIKYINNNFKNQQIISEERHVQNIKYDYDSYFIIDPIDGTNELINGSDDWSLSIAYIYKRKPIVGMLYFPYKNFKIYCIKNGGLQTNKEIVYNKNNSNKIKIAVSPRQIQSPDIKELLNKNNLEAVAIPTFTTKILSILLGEVDAAVYFPQKNKSANLWDYAASVLLLEEQKYKISSLDGNPLKFDKNNLEHTGGWLASRKSLHKNLLNKLNL